MGPAGCSERRLWGRPEPHWEIEIAGSSLPSAPLSAGGVVGETGAIYRRAMSVLVILRESETAEFLPWAVRFARARGNSLIVVRPSADGKDFDCDNIHAADRQEPCTEDLKELLNSLRRAFPHPPLDGREPLKISLCSVPAENFADAALAIIEAKGPQLLLLPRPLDAEGPVRRVFRAASCETVVLDLGIGSAPPEDRPGEIQPNDALPPAGLPLGGDAPLRRILVPTSTGSNARMALTLARSLVGTDGEVDAVFVEPPIGAEAESVGERILEREMRRALGGAANTVRALVVVARDPVAGIVEVARQGDYDLVILGATEGLPSPRMRKGSIPDRVRRGVEGTPVAVTRRGIPLAHRIERAVIRMLRALVPQLSRDERVDLVGKIQASSSFNFDFVTLVCLSTLIAGLGLIRNSAAVVIGAMLVAPLMTPLVGCGLALVHGNLILIRNAARSVALGFCLSFAIGVGLGVLVPDVGWTEELLSRGQPGRLDLIVALASGLAAAYATARPGLSGALPGVAIAAALVPPIATTGIGVALGQWADALGALLLFVSNIVAIVLGAAFSLYALGMRGEREPERQDLWIRPVLAVLLVIGCGLTIALGTKIHAALDVARVTKELKDAIVAELDEDNATMRSIRAKRTRGTEPDGSDQIDLMLRIDTPIPPTTEFAKELEEIAEEFYSLPVRVRVAASIVVEGGS